MVESKVGRWKRFRGTVDLNHRRPGSAYSHGGCDVCIFRVNGFQRRWVKGGISRADIRYFIGVGVVRPLQSGVVGALPLAAGAETTTLTAGRQY